MDHPATLTTLHFPQTEEESQILDPQSNHTRALRMRAREHETSGQRVGAEVKER